MDVSTELSVSGEEDVESRHSLPGQIQTQEPEEHLENLQL